MTDFETDLRAAVGVRNQPRFARPLSHLLRARVPDLVRSLGTLRPTAVKLFFGTRMEIVLPEAISCHLYRYGYYEEGLSWALIKLLRPGDAMFDIGSHFGYISLLAAAMVGPSGRVVAFEPTPSTQDVLRSNLAPLPQATVVPCAVWREAGTLTLIDFGPVASAFNSFAAARHGLPAGAAHTPISVDAITIDGYVAGSGIIPNFIKIDAESAEMAILEGGRRTLTRHRPIVTLEVGDHDVPGAALSRNMIEYMRHLGYVAYEVRSLEFLEHKPRDRYEYDNLIFLPEKGPAPVDTEQSPKLAFANR